MSTAPALHLPPAVRGYVARYVRRLRRLTLWRAAGRAIAFALALMLAACAADRIWQLPMAGRAALLGLTALGAVLIVARPLRAFLRRGIDYSAATADIEAHSPQFAERLMTVTSRVLGPAEHRGSDDMLLALLHDVDRTAAKGRRARPVKAGAVLWPWILVALLIGATAALARVPALGLPDLLVRFVVPTTRVEPVTTTQLAVIPGDINLPQGKPLRIVVRAEQLPAGAGGVTVAISPDNGRSWARAAMLPPAGDVPGADRYEFTLSSIDRDLRYYVSGGDATSPHYRVRVLRQPAVASFSVRYTYPDALGRPSLTVTNTDGLLEAPAGTDAVLTVVATEPLQSAQLRIGAQRIVMQRAPGEGENVRQARLRIERDAPCQVDLISTRDVPGGGPPTMRVRAVPDAPPLVRLIQPTGSLRLNPREIVPLTYEALDDYGIDALDITVQPPSGPAAHVPLTVRGDARRQEETHHLDLAAVGLKVGDVVTVTITAKDRVGKSASSEPLQILVSPRSVDVDTHVRVAELASASGMAALVADELEAANAAAEEADRERGKNAAAVASAVTRSNKHLSSAAETSALVRQALLRAVVRAGKSEVSGALAGWIDNVQQISSLTEDLFGQKSISSGDVSAEERDRMRERLSKLLDTARRTRDELKVLAQGEQAAALLADRENLKATESSPGPKEGTAAERRKQTLRRAADEIAGGVKRLGLDPGDKNVGDRLRERAKQAESLVKSRKAVDFQQAARDWSQALQRDASRASFLDERLLTAAQAEAVRPFGEIVRARDLHLAGRAAAAIAQQAAVDKAAKRVVGAGAPNQFVQALAALEREHDYDRKPRKRKQGEDVAIRNAAKAARQVLAGYAGDSGAEILAANVAGGATSKPISPTDRAVKKRAEELALRASAAAARRDYDEAARLDEALIEHVSQATAASATSPSVSVVQGPPVPVRVAEQKQRIVRTMQEARQIDRINEDQDKLVDQTEAATPEAVTALAGEQQRVATAIAGVQGGRMGILPSVDLNDPASDPNWRSKATATVVAAQEQLAAMPQRLGEARQASDAWRDAVRRAEEAKRMARETRGQARFAADRAARQMEQDAKEAEDKTRRLTLPVSAAAAEALAERLGPFAPEAADARDVVQQQLVAALRDFEQAVTKKEGDGGAADRAAAAVRSAIEAAQSQLALAQEAFTERDPLVAAKWFARAAADSLTQNPPNVKAAQQRQLEATTALARAWDQTIHDAAAQRLGVVPSMQPLYAAPAYATRPGDEGSPTAPTMATVREWSRLRPRETDASVSAPLRDADPPGYEDALQKYFESLQKAQEKGK